MRWFIAIKRLLKLPFIMILTCLLLGSLFLQKTEKEIHMKPFGFYAVDQDEIAQEFYSNLEEKGFLKYSDKMTLMEDIKSGELDSGAIISEDIGEKIVNNQLTEAAQILYTPQSFMKETYTAQIMTQMFVLSNPARMAQSAEEVGAKNTTQIMIEEELQTLYENGKVFSFSLQTVQGAAPDFQKNYDLLPEMFVALLLTLMTILQVQKNKKETRQIAAYTGIKSARKMVLFPSCVIFYFITAGISIAALGISYLVYVLIYLILLIWIGLLVSNLSENVTWFLLPVQFFGGIVLYPVYFDISQYLTWLQYLRFLIPTTWLFLLKENWLNLMIIGAGLLLLTILMALMKKGKTYD